MKNEIKVTDIEFATTLLYHEIPIKDTEKNGSKIIFIFENNPRIRELQIKFINGDLAVDLKKFMALLRSTKGLFIFGSTKDNH